MSAVSTASLLRTATEEAEDKRSVVDLLIRDLAAAMRDIHGGEWMYILDHQRTAVILYREFDGDAQDRPKRGVV